MPYDLPDGTVGTDIIAQTIPTLAIDIKTQTLAALNINILACAPTLNINIAASATTLNVNILTSAITIPVSGTVVVSIGTVETLSNITHIAGARDIDMGMPAIDRPKYSMTNNTLIDQENPADASGILDNVEIWAYKQLKNCKVGILQKTGAHKYRCRSVAFLGTVPAGSKQTFAELSLDVREGDFLGIYFSSGYIDVSDYDPATYPKGYDGTWGDILIVGLETDNVDYTIGEVISLHGFATRYPLLAQPTFGGKVYRNTSIAHDNNPRRFITTKRLLRDVIILVEDYDQLFGDSSYQTFPVVQGDSFPITQIDISTLYFKNRVAGQNGTVRILAVEE